MGPPPLEVVHKVWWHKGYVLNVFSKLAIRFGRRPFFFCSSINFGRKIGPSSSPNFVRIIGLILGGTISNSDVCSSQSYWSSWPSPPTTTLFAYRYCTTGKIQVVSNNFWHWAENIWKISPLRYIELVQMLLCYTIVENHFTSFLFLSQYRGFKFCVFLCLYLSWIKCMEKKWNNLVLFNNVYEFNFAKTKLVCLKRCNIFQI